MKKLISLLAVVSMISATMSISALAAQPTDPTISIAVEPTTIEIYNEMTYETIDDAKYDAYKLLVTYSNIGTVESTVTGSGNRAKFSGRNLYSQKLALQFSSLENVRSGDDVASLGDDSITADYSYGSWDTANRKFNVSIANDRAYPGLTNTSVTGKIENALVIYIAVKDGTSVDVTATDGTLIFNQFKDSKVEGSNEAYTVGSNNINLPASFTLGATAPAGYTFTKGTYNEVEADGINGVVWAGNKMENFDLVNKSYVAKFTATGVEPKTRTLTNLNAATLETDGSITFDAILRFKDNTVKPGLDFTVVEE